MCLRRDDSFSKFFSLFLHFFCALLCVLIGSGVWVRSEGGKISYLSSMAKVFAERSLVSPPGERSSGVSSERRNCSSPAFLRCSLRPSSWGRDFYGRRLGIGVRNEKGSLRASPSPLPVLMTLTIGKSLKWWEKGLQSNMKHIESAEDLSNALLNAGDQLVIVDFFSPGCAGCRALHPKICQFAEMNPGVQFLQVNYEMHKSMCYSLNVHVLPFFRFYRGAHGRLCSFSCTNATIKKFKDALAKHSTSRCSLGPARGLEESELLALAANKDLSFNYTAEPVQHPTRPQEDEEKAPASSSLPVHAASSLTKESIDEKALVSAGR